MNFINPPGQIAQLYNPSATYRNFKYQEQELQETGFYAFKWRNYDPSIGRFFNVDPLSEKYTYNSTYAFQENKMGLGRELEGLELVPFEFLVMSNSSIEPAIPIAEASLREIPIEPVTIIASRATPPPEIGLLERIGNAISRGWDALTGGNKAEPTQTMDKVTESVKPESVAESVKPRNGPEETGIPESSKIDGKDAAGKTTKYTEYGKDGNWTKQVEGNRGVPRHGIEGATKKVPTTNTNPKTGETFQGKPKIEPATPEETPPGNNIKTN